MSIQPSERTYLNNDNNVREAIRTGLRTPGSLGFSGLDEETKEARARQLIALQLSHMWKEPNTRVELAATIASATNAISIGYERKWGSGDAIRAVDTYLDSLITGGKPEMPSPERHIGNQIDAYSAGFGVLAGLVSARPLQNSN